MIKSIANRQDKFNEFLEALREKLKGYVVSEIERQLEAEVTEWLRRRYHVRRKRVKGNGQAQCQRCGTRAVRAFSRNGHRQRQVVTTYGVLRFWLPRVVCQCGGSVAIPFTILQPYQRWWDDMLEQINRWADLGLSLRQMQGEIGDQFCTQVGLRKLNSVVQSVPVPPLTTLSSVPPIILLDAIWVTLLQPTRVPTIQADSLKRQRCVKTKYKVCVMVALGLYPQQGTWGILNWHIASQESQVAWEALLVPLEQRGVYRQRGLELFIQDGGKGLLTTLNLMYPTIPHQRCLFHKLRNLWHTIQVPQDMTHLDRLSFKTELLQQVQPIFYAQDAVHAQHLRDELCAQWLPTQHDFVNTLQRDWHETIAFYRVLARFPSWSRTTLRTTSLLERVNRMLRRLFRAAGAFHSLAGLNAAAARILVPHLLF